MNNLLMAQHGGKKVVVPPTLGVLSFNSADGGMVMLKMVGQIIPTGFMGAEIYRDGVLLTDCFAGNFGGTLYFYDYTAVDYSTYIYKVKVYGSDGIRSEYSNEVEVVLGDITNPVIVEKSFIPYNGGYRLVTYGSDNVQLQQLNIQFYAWDLTRTNIITSGMRTVYGTGTDFLFYADYLIGNGYDEIVFGGIYCFSLTLYDTSGNSAYHYFEYTIDYN